MFHVVSDHFNKYAAKQSVQFNFIVILARGCMYKHTHALGSQTYDVLDVSYTYSYFKHVCSYVTSASIIFKLQFHSHCERDTRGLQINHCVVPCVCVVLRLLNYTYVLAKLNVLLDCQVNCSTLCLL